MRFGFTSLGVAFLVIQLVSAHFYIDLINNGTSALRPISSLGSENFPVTGNDIIGDNMICNTAQPFGAYATGPLSVTAGDTVTVHWTNGPGDTNPIGAAHYGPCMVYIGQGLKPPGWTKIYETTPDSAGDWCLNLIGNNANLYTFKVPSALAPGNYVVRIHLTALHAAGSAGGAQFYVRCMDLIVTGSGTSIPPFSDPIPGTWNLTTPGKTASDGASYANYYPSWGGTLWAPSASGSSSTTAGTSASGTTKTTTTTTTTKTVTIPSTSTLTTTSSTSSITSTSTGSSTCLAAYAQCGGTGFTSLSCCVSGYYCYTQSQYYSQCIPGTASSSTGSATTTTTSAATTTTKTTTTTTLATTTTKAITTTTAIATTTTKATISTTTAAATSSPVTGVVFSDGFENGLGSWTITYPSCSGTGTATIDNTVANSGTNSLKISGGGGFCNHVFALNTAIANIRPIAYVRYYVNHQTAMPTSHHTFIAMTDANDGNNDLRLGGQNSKLSWNRQSDDATCPSQSPVGIAASVTLPINQWTCMELEIDTANGYLFAWMNDVAVTALTVQNGIADIDAAWKSSKPSWTPSPQNLKLGWESYGSDADVYWYDDVVVGSSRIGCGSTPATSTISSAGTSSSTSSTRPTTVTTTSTTTTTVATSSKITTTTQAASTTSSSGTCVAKYGQCGISKIFLFSIKLIF
ncbi:hypothetical protein HK096_000736 [Nowakowskiella sp. JEL0078]|nr:hypothetical protein HK096_000736 [Nowakowskiella sp. JEL0078]